MLPDATVIVVDMGPHSAARLRWRRSFSAERANASDGAVTRKPVRLCIRDDRGQERTLDDQAERQSGAQVFACRIEGDSIAAEPFSQAWQPPAAPDPTDDEVAMLPEVRIAAFPDGRVALADDERYRVLILSNTGEVLDTVGRRVHPLPVTEVAKAAERERRAARMTERSIAAAVRDMAAAGIGVVVDVEPAIEQYRAELEDLQFAEEIPVIRAFQVDWGGRMWITRADETGDDGPIDLMHSDGSYEGTIRQARRPDAFGPDGLLAYIDDHELGTQSIVVVRITSMAPAGYQLNDP